MRMLHKLFDWLFAAPPAPPPMRKVISRVHAECGKGGGDEIIELECGHHIKLIRHQHSSFPCQECGEQEDHAG